MKKTVVLTFVAALAVGAHAGDTPVVTPAASVTGGIVIGGGASTGAGGTSTGGGANNVPAGSPLQVAISGGPLVVRGGNPGMNAEIIAAMEAAGIPTDNVTFTDE